VIWLLPLGGMWGGGTMETCSHGDLLAALHSTQRHAADLTAQVGTLTAALARMVALEEQARRRAEDCEARHGAGFGGFEGREEAS